MSDTHAATAPQATDPGARVLAVSPAQLLHDWKTAHDRARAYLDALGVPEDERYELATAAVARALEEATLDAERDVVAATIAALAALLVERDPRTRALLGDVDGRFLAWRRQRVIPPAAAERTTPSMPPLTRGAIVPEKLELRGFSRLVIGRARGHHIDRDTAPQRQAAWRRVAHSRRMLLGLLILIPSAIASAFMLEVLPYQGRTVLESTIAAVFGALFGWISIGFWTALLGFLLLLRGRDRFAITAADDGTTDVDASARTAIVMPICDEPVDRVFAGLRAIHRSLERAGALDRFDFFVLSDTTNPATWVREEEAWAAWCRATGSARLFYRRRRVRLKRKSGNVADFCRRWGRQYRYMIMLDADSMIAGDTLVRLVRLMERSPGVGMIQTAPKAVNRRTLFARLQQFTSAVYGPVFVAGLHYWQLGDGQYWGHNTIIRVGPFMAHCGLSRLPGKPPLGGEIMSHDFVEAALMGRAGWALWLAYDLGGSYEETPSSLLEEMQRDRRWCQGNLQHLRLLFTEGLYGAHRALFLNGVMSYVSALLWLCFLSLSTAKAILAAVQPPDYFPDGPSLFPEWPIWRPDWVLALLAVTASMLFLPKILAVLLILLKRHDARAFGGAGKLVRSVMLEILMSALLAPIRMVFYTRFVLTNLLGRTVSWGSPSRDDAATTWGDAVRRHGLDTVVASAWGLSVYWLNADYFWWLLPVVGALILSVPVSVVASRARVGDAARRAGHFTIPEENAPPRELVDLTAGVRAAEEAARRLTAVERDGFVRAAVDPLVNALHRTLLRGPRSLAPTIRARRRRLLERAVAEGPEALDRGARRLLLLDGELMRDLHSAVWALDDAAAQRWGRPGSAPSR